MNRIKKHAVTVLVIAVVVAIGLMIWSRKATAEPMPSCAQIPAAASMA